MNEQVSLKQKRLASLLQKTSGLIRIEDAMNVFGLDREHVAKLLAGWEKQGSLRRVARGLYVSIQPQALGKIQVLEDPWILVPELYAPGYIGGWTALEYWELTEQIFRAICVFTSKRTIYGETKHQGVSFFIKHISPKQLFGTKAVWCNNIKIQISDPYKTILDTLDDPKLGAGLQHLTDCLSEFRNLFGKKSDLEQLLWYAIQINKGSLFKKLGFLAERLKFDPFFIKECSNRITKGYSYLDNTSEENKLATKWHLWIPKEYKQ